MATVLPPPPPPPPLSRNRSSPSTSAMQRAIVSHELSIKMQNPRRECILVQKFLHSLLCRLQYIAHKFPPMEERKNTKKLLCVCCGVHELQLDATKNEKKKKEWGNDGDKKRCKNCAELSSQPANQSARRWRKSNAGVVWPIRRITMAHCKMCSAPCHIQNTLTARSPTKCILRVNKFCVFMMVMVSTSYIWWRRRHRRRCRCRRSHSLWVNNSASCTIFLRSFAALRILDYFFFLFVALQLILVHNASVCGLL